MTGNTPMNKPNGTITAYYGDATLCIKHLLDLQDYHHAIMRPDAAKWSLSAQSGTVVDGHGFLGNTIKFGCYRGYE